jgi:hypothetical protein
MENYVEGSSTFVVKENGCQHFPHIFRFLLYPPHYMSNMPTFKPKIDYALRLVSSPDNASTRLS